MFPPVRPSVGGASSNSNSPPAPEPAEDNAVPGPSSAPDGFGASRAAVARAQAGGSRRGQKRKAPSRASDEVAGTASQPSTESSEATQVAIAELEAVCRERGITVNSSLYRLINACPEQEKTLFIQKIIHFFRQVRGVKNTQVLTNMLGPTATDARRATLLSMSEEDIAYVAQSECIQGLGSMCSLKGLPSAQSVRKLLGHHLLAPAGQLDTQLLKSIVSMRTAKGIPTPEEVTALLNLDVFKTGGEFNVNLFQIVSRFYYSKGFPAPTVVSEFLAEEIMQTEEGELDLERLSTLASLCRSKGFPTPLEVANLFSMDCLMVEGRFNDALFSPVCGLFSGKGIPAAEDVAALFAMDVLKRDGQIDLSLLKSISSMYHKKGMPDLRAVRELLSMPELMVQAGERVLLSCISSMCNGRSIPSVQSVREVFAVPWIRKPDGQINQDVLRSVSNMQHSRGMPTAAHVQRLLSLPELQSRGRLDVPLLKKISALYGSRGIPSSQEVKNLLSLRSLYRGGQLDMVLLQRLAAMGAGKGFPSTQLIKDAKRLVGQSGEISEEEPEPDVSDNETDMPDAAQPTGAGATDARAGTSAALTMTGQPSTTASVSDELDLASTSTGLHFWSSLVLPEGPADTAAAVSDEPDFSSMIATSAGLHFWSSLTSPEQVSGLQLLPEGESDTDEPPVQQASSPERCDTPPLVASPRHFLAKRRKE